MNISLSKDFSEIIVQISEADIAYLIFCHEFVKDGRINWLMLELDMYRENETPSTAKEE